MATNGRDWLLLAVAGRDGRSLRPVGGLFAMAVLFLLQRKIPDLPDLNLRFGASAGSPFCPEVYGELETLASSGLLLRVHLPWTAEARYVASDRGRVKAVRASAGVPEAALGKLEELRAWALERHEHEWVAAMRRCA